MSKTSRIVLAASGVLVACGLVSALLAYRASQQVPQFYDDAIRNPTPMAESTGDLLEEQLFAFSNRVRKPSRWTLRLTNGDINSWLANDLEDKFPNLLPKHIEEPRISIQEDQVLLGCQFHGQNLSSVLAISLDIYLIEDQDNMVGVQIHNATAGQLPIPLKNILDQVTKYADKAEIPLRWQVKDGDPLAMVTVPSEGPEINGRIRIDSLEVRDGEILLSGETLKPEVELASKPPKEKDQRQAEEAPALQVEPEVESDSDPESE
ncbi:MAG: hypothetical protein WD045_04715 [Pirellulaceae bacterium]